MIRINVVQSKPVSMHISAVLEPVRISVPQAVTVAAGEGGIAYEGSYVITPKVTPQTLPTKDRRMSDDMSIKAIPRFDVSNTAGGTTVYIGKEI